jgi:hypothetical protein
VSSYLLCTTEIAEDNYARCDGPEEAPISIQEKQKGVYGYRLGPDVRYFGRKGQDMVIVEKGCGDAALSSRGDEVQIRRLTYASNIEIVMRGAGGRPC